MSAARPIGLLNVVLDTNVYFSAFASGRGVPFELWQRAVRREYALLISPPMIRELAEVLRMDLAWPEPEIIAQLRRVAKVAKIVNPTQALHVVKTDPDDDRIKRMRGGGERRPHRFRRPSPHEAEGLPGYRDRAAKGFLEDARDMRGLAPP
jgi:hypothetical protein